MKLQIKRSITRILILSAMLILAGSTCVQAKEAKTQKLKSVYDIKAGKVLDKSQIDFKNLDRYFKAYKIDKEVFKRIKNKTFDPKGTVKKSDLRYIKLIHYNYKHKIQVGELIVNKSIAKDVTTIFKKLFKKGYEIKSMYLIEKYWQDNHDDTDTASCDAGNTSAFFYRHMAGSSTRMSNHAYGMAIDINTRENPYVWYQNGKPTCNHENAMKYVDRRKKYKHMITEDDYCYKLFKKYGFFWGGHWKRTPDYQHFEKR